jgi:hypothetical protein
MSVPSTSVLVLCPFLNHYSWPILASREQTVVGVSQWYCYETGKRGSNVQPTRVLPALSVLSLVSVEYSGWALLGFLTGRGQLGVFRELFFRAGHAQAGVLLVLSRLLPLPGQDRVLIGGPVARRPARGDHRPVWRFLPPPRPWAEEQKLCGNCGDANPRPVPCGGVGHLGRRPALGDAHARRSTVKKGAR